MILNGCFSNSGSFCLKNKAWPVKSYVPSPHLSAHFPSSRIRNSCGCIASKGNLSLKLSASSTRLFSPVLPTTRKLLKTPKAAKDVPPGFRFPAMAENPKWWWRTLACLPYMLNIETTLEFAELAHLFSPSLEVFEILSYTLSPLGKIPIWVEIANWFFYFFVTIVMKKKCPHFLRSHMVIALLLRFVMKLIIYASCWSPLAVYWGKMGMHFWATMTIVCLFMVLECFRCALVGMYSDIPFVTQIKIQLFINLIFLSVVS